jgi:hypothetical protein
MARIQISNAPSGRIIVSLLYDPLLVEKVKSIDGRKWHPAKNTLEFRQCIQGKKAPSPFAPACTKRFGEGRGEGWGEGYNL